MGGGALGAPGGLRPTQIRVFQHTVRHVGRVAVQVAAFLTKKDLAARTAPAARPQTPRLQHAALLREAALPVGGTRALSTAARLLRGVAPVPAPAPHLSAGATRLLSSAKGPSQPQKPGSARRSGATCRVLDSWRSGQ